MDQCKNPSQLDMAHIVLVPDSWHVNRNVGVGFFLELVLDEVGPWE